MVLSRHNAELLTNRITELFLKLPSPIATEKSEEVRKINAMGYKMKKVGPCNFGSYELKKFFKKALVGQK